MGWIGKHTDSILRVVVLSVYRQCIRKLNFFLLQDIIVLSFIYASKSEAINIHFGMYKRILNFRSTIA